MNDTGKSAYNTQPAGLEKILDETFRQKAPFQLPDGLTKWLGSNVWWLALVGAALSALGVLSSLSALNQVSVTNVYLETYSLVNTDSLKNALYLSIVTSAISAVLLFMASPKLKQHQKAGWNLLYYNFLINIVVSVVGRVLFPDGSLVASLVGMIIGFVIGAYILFQVRPRFS